MKTYFYIYRVGNRAPSVRHQSLEGAVAEAERLSTQHPGETFEILKCIAITRTVEAKTFWMDGENPQIQYSGHAFCQKCKTSHWIYGPCPENVEPSHP